MRKKSTLSLLFLLVFLPQAFGNNNTERAKSNDSRIRTAIFRGNGASGGCVTDAYSALKIDGKIDISIITANDVLNGGLKHLDVIVFPGGGGSRQFSSLGSFAVEKIREFVIEDGKGVVGLCAGAYMLSNTPDYTCFSMSGYKAIDMEHDERGNGTISFKINSDGARVFPELKENASYFIHYYEGPILVSNPIREVETSVLAYMTSDVALKNDAPKGMTVNKPLFLNGKAGRGRVFLSVAHPENTPGLRWMLPRMVRWVSGKSLVSYSKEVVRPNIYTGEILFNKELSDEEDLLFKKVMRDNEEGKIASINRLVEIKSWSARDYIPGLLRDKAPQVRIAAARGLAELERIETIPEIETIIRIEKNQSVKKELSRHLERLKSMVGCDLK
ncbi:MAG: biofilm PGA synthesis protein PgaB [Oligoflexales bacterium]|nr:biofilm PGA synthesis protein PgaB [Oligoflexales bacterium]